MLVRGGAVLRTAVAAVLTSGTRHSAAPGPVQRRGPSSQVTHSMWAAVLVAGLLAVSRLQALLLARVTVPPFGLGGAAASLGCEYDPQGDAVYSVKWYKVSLVPGAGVLSAVVGAGRPRDLPLPALQQPRRGRVRPARGQHRHQPQQRHAPPPGTAQRGQHRQVPCCAVLYCTVLYCTVLHCTVHCTAGTGAR